MEGVITDNDNCVSTGGEKALESEVGVGGWFVDNRDRVIWCKRGGRVINVWDEYVAMLGSIREFLFGGEFLSNEKYRRGSKKTLDVQTAVRRYIRDVYGCSFSQTYSLVHGVSVNVNHNVIYDALIDYYGIDGMDWGYLSRGVRCFYTDNDKILEYIANDTLVKGGMYDYFIKNHALKVDGVGINTSRRDGRSRKVIRLKWRDGGRTCDLSELVVNKRHAWKHMTKDEDRVGIRDYDRFLDGRDESLVMPDRCPVFGNVVLNYTGIDFNNGMKNKKRCSLTVYEGSNEIEWSAASIDRIDSNKGYTYDNIRVISDFANGLKNCYSEYHFERVLEYVRSNPK